jgi:hypothetical protein
MTCEYGAIGRNHSRRRRDRGRNQAHLQFKAESTFKPSDGILRNIAVKGDPCGTLIAGGRTLPWGRMARKMDAISCGVETVRTKEDKNDD